jgi:hypothetical protein
MSLPRPIHWFHARANLILPVGPFKVRRVNLCTVGRPTIRLYGQRVKLFHYHKNTDTVTADVYF